MMLVCTLAILAACDSNQGSGEQPSKLATVESASVDASPVAYKTENPILGTGQYMIDLAGEGISIRANQVDELALFKVVAEAARFQLLTGDVNWKVVSVDIHADTLHAAVVDLVKNYPYTLVYAPSEDNQEAVLSKVVLGDPQTTDMTDKDGEETVDAALDAIELIKIYPKHERQYAYLQNLQSPSPEIRAAVAKEIEAEGEALGILIDMLLNDPSPEVRIATTWAIENSEEPEALESLVKCLGDKNNTVVEECISSLEFSGNETTVVHLQPLLTHQDEKVRTRAFEAIRTLQ